ncbi:hypothetical protein GPECTOR_15g416 [Gonium pectorale]|uniref:Uncharacterized protein n=1 Tax=Gonium pectorale TaxID=33097 RepID=A0A150GLT6_GONPE|nr:hypothetical protein GPECTOR_15g416 [Gonium pectorale]|eukprot:KXZ50732.1 hypothetical protein GPECTOR_15g416 [Gonium pectorale]
MADAGASSGEVTRVTAVSCGSSHSVALLSCDVVASWGRGEDGQLGHGQADECLIPTAITALTDAGIDNVVCGAEYTVAVASSRGQIYSWGWGDFGRLGHGDCNDVFVPRPIAFFAGTPVSRVACGDTHTLVVAGEGELFTFGRNQNGQLGLGHTNDCLSPQRVTALQFGQLGLGDTEDRSSPTLVAGALAGRAVAVLACGWRHTVAVTADGQVFSWGRGVNGQLGHGVEQDLHEPTLLSSLSRGQLRREDILATAAPDGGGYVAPADRYAVVPGADEPFANGGSSAAAVAAVPSVPEVPADAEAEGAGSGTGAEGAAASDEGRSPKKARTSVDM